MPLIDVAAAKKQLNIADGDPSQDDELQTYVDAAIGAAELARGEVIDTKTVTDTLNLRRSDGFLLANVPVQSLTSVVSVDDSTTWDVSGMYVDTDSGYVTVLSGPLVSGLVKVTYTAGYIADKVPPAFKLGALIILQHLWETQRGTQGTVQGIVGETQVYDPRYSYAIPRRAQELLGSPLSGVA